MLHVHRPVIAFSVFSSITWRTGNANLINWNTMTPTILHALRRLLFLSIEEAAEFIALHADTNHSASVLDWKQWESGTQQIPEYVVQKIIELVDWRSAALAATADNIRQQIKASGGMPESIFVIWYEHLADWESLPNRAPVMWRIQQSVCSALAGMFRTVRLVSFDPVAYAIWLGDRGDSESLRGQWAATA